MLGAAATGPTAGEATGRLISSKRLWWLVFVAGAAIWLFAAIVTGLTRDPILVPTIVLLGSFLVPVSMVVLALSHADDDYLTGEVLLIGFVVGGTLGLVFAALTEVYFLPSVHVTFLAVGFIEESTKGLVLVAVAAQVKTHRARDGMILGATVGAGFSAFESAGYALKTVIGHADDHPVVDILETEASRAILAPFGHITWTALLGGALFAAWSGGALRPTARLLWTFVGVVLLHAAWDSSYGWSVLITQGLVGPEWDWTWPSVEKWIGTPTNDELTVFTVTYYVLLGVNALAGTVWVVRSWRGYGAEPTPEAMREPATAD